MTEKLIYDLFHFWISKTGIPEPHGIQQIRDDGKAEDCLAVKGNLGIPMNNFITYFLNPFCDLWYVIGYFIIREEFLSYFADARVMISKRGFQLQP